MQAMTLLVIGLQSFAFKGSPLAISGLYKWLLIPRWALPNLWFKIRFHSIKYLTLCVPVCHLATFFFSLAAFLSIRTFQRFGSMLKNPLKCRSDTLSTRTEIPHYLRACVNYCMKTWTSLSTFNIKSLNTGDDACIECVDTCTLMTKCEGTYSTNEK